MRRKFKVGYLIIALLLVGAAGFVIFRIHLKSELEVKLEAIRAAGYPTTGAELNAWYSIPESAENAADMMIEAFDHYYDWNSEYLEDLPILGEAELPGRTEDINQASKTAMAEFLADNSKAMELLHKAARIEHSRYPVDLGSGFSLMPYLCLSDIRKGAKRLQLEAVLHAENDEPQLAINSVEAIFGVGHSLANEPLLISQLVRIAIEALSVGTLERVVNRTELTDEQMAGISQMYLGAEDSNGLSRAFAGERCMYTSVFDMPASGMSGFGGGGWGLSPVLSLYKAVGLADTDKLLYLDYMGKNIEAFKLPLNERSKAFKAIEAEFGKVSKIHVLLHILMPALSRVAELDLRRTAHIRVAVTSLAIERYRLAGGSVVDGLDELVPRYLESVPEDPFDGKSLKYKKLDVGYVVYSVGEDRVDDGGLEDTQENRITASGRRTCDIAFVVER